MKESSFSFSFSFFFHLFTINLLSLLLPLSFLLLARLISSHNYYLSIPQPILLSLVFYINLPLLFLLISLVSISTLSHSLTGKSPLPNQLHNPISQPRLYTAWILLCVLQVCVGVGIEGSLSIGINDASSFGRVDGELWSRVLFFLGLHETAVCWTRVVVKPVVDDTVFGEAKEERWFEKAAMAVSFGCLWWWRLRDEVEALVMAGEAKGNGVGLEEFSGWCLYYIIVAIGIAKIFKSLTWVGGIFICKKESKSSSSTVHENDDKV